MFRLVALFLIALGLSAQDAMVTVRKEGARKETVSLAGLSVSGPNATVFLKTLQGDLERSGWFRLGPTGSIRVSGRVTDSGSGISSACTVVGARKQFTWNRSSSADEVRRQAHLLADEMVRILMGETGIASTRIAVVNHRGPNNADLYVCDADGYNMRRITANNRAVVGPRWTPDAAMLYFTSYVKDFPAIYKIPANGGSMRALMRFPGLNTGAAISPNGSVAALILSYQGNPELYTFNLRSGLLTRLTNTKFAAEASPCWSPDGRSIVYVSDPTRAPQLYIIDVASKQSRRLTYRGSENVNPSWHKNGKIAFATKRGGGYQIATIDPSRGESTIEIVGEGESPSWGADGRHILCSRGGSGRSAVYMLDTLGDPAVCLTKFSGNWICPNWSPR